MPKPFDQLQLIDTEIFEQFLDLDDDPDDKSFSRDLVIKYLEQAHATLDQIAVKLYKHLSSINS